MSDFEPAGRAVMRGIHLPHLRDLIIIPVLDRLANLDGAGPGWNSAAAVRLLIGTALVESGGGKNLRQLPDGPALGIYQMEPATHDDIWRHYLRTTPMAHCVEDLIAVDGIHDNGVAPPAGEMIGNLYYATAMARCHYRRVPAALPDAGDIAGLAGYWKQHFNTRLGKGEPEKFIGLLTVAGQVFGV